MVLIPPLDERLDAIQDAVQAEDELVVRAVVGLEHLAWCGGILAVSVVLSTALFRRRTA